LILLRFYVKITAASWKKYWQNSGLDFLFFLVSAECC